VVSDSQTPEPAKAHSASPPVISLCEVAECDIEQADFDTSDGILRGHEKLGCSISDEV
jgi:hypothetical protein